MRHRRSFAVLLVPFVIACDSTGDGSTVRTELLTSPETVVSTESELIGGLADMRVSDGRLYLTDRRNARVMMVPLDSGDPLLFGRSGAGPGEFRTPSAIGVNGDTVIVFDRELGRVQTFAGGQYVDGWTVPPPQLGTSSIDSNGRLALATGGRSDAMIEVWDAGGQLTAAFGALVAPQKACGSSSAGRRELGCVAAGW